MFQTARMRKIKIITHDEYVSPTVKTLHEEGIVQINDISDRVQHDPELAKSMAPSKAHPQSGKISSLLMKTTGISELFGNAISEDSGIMGMVKGFFSLDMPPARMVNDESNDELIKKAEDTLSKVESQSKVIENRFSALDAEKSKLEANQCVAKRLINLDMDLSLLKDTKYTSTAVGRIDAEFFSEVKEKLSNLNDELIFNEVKDNNDEFKIIVVVALKENKDEVFSILRKYNFDKFDLEDLEGTPEQIVSSTTSRLSSIENEFSNSKKELKELALKWDNDILVLKEELENAKERNEISSSFLETRDTKMLEAWIPLNDIDKFKEMVEKTTQGYCIFDVEDVGDDDEEVPVLQKNIRYAKPYELLVQMYAPVRYNSIDPTIFVALMFPFLFGFCLTDAVYGSIVSLIGVILVVGMKKCDSSTMKSFGYILITSGLWSILLGLISNGFLGDFPERMLGYRLPTIIPSIEAFVHPDTILIIAIAIGIIYLNIGFVVGLINNIRYKNKKEAIGSQIVWFVLEAGIICLALGFLMPAIGMIGMGLGGLLIVLSLVLLIYANGVYGIMDVFGFLGDVLSFARLLALCLATGGIAMTVNILTQLVGDMIPYVGFILAIVVFIGGHVVNFLFQVLGAFVNALRLHYVEFFSQFYSSGKNKFEAFKSDRCFTKLKNN
ncbi:V-type ATP synthase subunit I [Methanobrevibacter sp. DSM 116169]|uniref:V-type ATP synthase subunit I n=1 Tax=Methanobrevibacter sp. DSM 116169 TaxID=3242727 RepID=UPI0038FD3DC7